MIFRHRNAKFVQKSRWIVRCLSHGMTLLKCLTHHKIDYQIGSLRPNRTNDGYISSEIWKRNQSARSTSDLFLI